MFLKPEVQLNQYRNTNINTLRSLCPLWHVFTGKTNDQLD